MMISKGGGRWRSRTKERRGRRKGREEGRRGREGRGSEKEGGGGGVEEGGGSLDYRNPKTWYTGLSRYLGWNA